MYVEPTTYQDVTDAVREFANELDRNWVELGRIIGGGVCFLRAIFILFATLYHFAYNLFISLTLICIKILSSA